MKSVVGGQLSVVGYNGVEKAKNFRLLKVIIQPRSRPCWFTPALHKMKIPFSE